jgi:hypothetical protein
MKIGKKMMERGYKEGRSGLRRRDKVGRRVALSYTKFIYRICLEMGYQNFGGEHYQILKNWT